MDAGWGAALASSKPTFAVRFVAADLGILPFLDGLYGCAPEELRPDKTAIVGEALRALGWSPLVPLPDGLARTIEAERKSLTSKLKL